MARRYSHRAPLGRNRIKGILTGEATEQILDEVHCVPPDHAACAYAGCQRSCFLFWKEGWLERVPWEPTT